MMETATYLGTDIAGMMHAARVEARRIMQANKGDFVADHKAILHRLESAELVTDEEVETLLNLYKLGYEAGEGKGDPQRAF